MKKLTVYNSFFILLILLFELGCSSTSTLDKEIIEKRNESNQAIRDHDLETLSSQWTDNFLLISSRGNRFEGKAENKASYEQMFKVNPDEWYERTPEEIEVNEKWGMITESGTWKGRLQHDGTNYTVGGSYMAKWKRQDGDWKLLSEYYAPGYCNGGPFCNEIPEQSKSYRFHHTALTVQNLDRSIDFYQQLFNLQLTEKIDSLIDIKPDGSQKARPTSIAFLQFEGKDHVLEIIETSVPLDTLQLNSGYRHVGVSVDNIQAVWEKAIDLGAVPLRSPWSLIANGKNVSIGFLLGPDNETIELMQWN